MSEHASTAPSPRASDEERETVVERLRVAMSEGRLSLTELADRTEVAYAARTRGDLAELTADLPATERVAPRASSGGNRKWLVGVLGDLKRSGSWDAQDRLGSVAVFGDVVLDLCAARLSTSTAEISAYAVFGDVKIIVPPGVRVEMDGFGIFGDTKSEVDEPEDAGAPTVRLTGYAVFGDVKASYPKEKKPSRWRRMLERRSGE